MSGFKVQHMMKESLFMCKKDMLLKIHIQVEFWFFFLIIVPINLFFFIVLGQVNLISRLSYRSPKNIGRVGGFYFMIFISPKKNN
jgi:hypothetical protein